MQPIKRAAFTLEILSSWAILTLLISAVIIRIIYKIDIPMFPTLADDITNMTDVTSLQKLCMLILDATEKGKDQAWLLATWGGSLVALWSGIFGIAAIYLARLLRRSEQGTTRQERPGMLEQAIAGELPSWKAFWLLYIGLPYVLALLTQGLLWGLKQYHVIEKALLADLLLSPLTQAAIFNGVAVGSDDGLALCAEYASCVLEIRRPNRDYRVHDPSDDHLCRHAELFSLAELRQKKPTMHRNFLQKDRLCRSSSYGLQLTFTT